MSDNMDSVTELFVSCERNHLNALDAKISWKDAQWKLGAWVPHRGKSDIIVFSTLPGGLKERGYKAPSQGPLPERFQEVAKAIIVFLQRSRNLGFSMVYAYSIALRRLYNALYERKALEIKHATRADFERVVQFLQESEYKNLYDAVAQLKVIADTLDLKKLTIQPINFEHTIKPIESRHEFISLNDTDRAVKQRKRDEKLPSREAMEAFAICTNSPLSDGEEILLRVIDLLIVTGQRGNEVAIIPVDCWVERPTKNAAGEFVKDASENAIVECGIRYFAEKQFQSRVHWLASADVPLARRAIKRLLELTKDARKVAK